MTMKKILALLLATALLLGMVACAGNNTTTGNNGTTGENTDGTTAPNGDKTTDPEGDKTTDPEGDKTTDPVGDDPTDGPIVTPSADKYTYMDWVSNLSTSWNPHTYETSDQSYPMDFISAGLYSFIFNDENNPVEGVEPYAGYVIVPEMAAEMPVDVTEQLKGVEKWHIPENATEGYAYTVKLNPLATWDDGTPIKAVDYVESMKRLLAPELANYRASSYYSGNLVLVGALDYYLQGQEVVMDNGETKAYTVADLVKGEDGNYYTPDTNMKVYIAVDYAISWCNGYSLATYVNAYGTTYFGLDRWNELVALMDDEGLVPCNDETLAMLSATTTTNANWGETDEDLPNYLAYDAVYGDYDWENVGIYESGEYEITIVLNQSLTGFYLLYNLAGNWIVKCDVYDACLTEENGAWYSTYNTSISTSPSYGPYIIDQYQMDKSMHFTKNENWYGYTDGKHTYVDPNDGEVYDMYQTTDISCVVVTEVSTAKMMFFAGELMAYGLQSDDYAEYGKSEFAHFTPGQAIYFIILNGYMDAIQAREAADGFDQSKYDLETLTLESFHRALGLSYDKQAYCDKFSPAQSPAFGLIGDAYIYDPDTGAKYRDTDQAKQVLCDVYGVNVDDFGGDYDEALATITGYDPVKAKEYFQQAYEEALEKGYITDTNGDGISDQQIKITYAASAEVSAKMKLILQWLTDEANKCAEGTGFAGKIYFDYSVPLGDEWSTEIKAGQKDVVLAGWTGSVMDPYNLMEVYVNDSYQYDGKWWNAKENDLTLTIDGEEITMNLYRWQSALCGTDQVDSDGNVRNFGSASQETRVDILAALEEKVLLTYNYLPFTQAGSYSLLSQKAYYIVEDYNPVMGRGGISYLRYNYNDAEWAEYIANNDVKY